MIGKRLYRISRTIKGGFYKENTYDFNRGHILARLLRAVQYSPEGKPPPAGTKLINWGCSVAPLWLDNAVWINKPSAVNCAVHKSMTFTALTEAEVPCLEWTGLPPVALGWLDEGSRVFARLTETGRGGEGIVVVEPGQALPKAPLYTRGFRKTHEYRVHVFNGKAIDVVQKKKTTQETGRNTVKHIRSYNNGWVFCHEDLDCDVGDYRAGLEAIGVRAVAALGLDFGAVDVLVRDREGRRGEWSRKVVVCEVNTAPNITAPTTLQAYLTAIEECIR